MALNLLNMWPNLFCGMNAYITSFTQLVVLKAQQLTLNLVSFLENRTTSIRLTEQQTNPDNFWKEKNCDTCATFKYTPYIVERIS